MTFTKTFLCMLFPCLLSSILFAFALEGVAAFSQCMLISLGIFLLANCAVTLANATSSSISMSLISFDELLNDEKLKELNKTTKYTKDEDGNWIEKEEDDDEKS